MAEVINLRRARKARQRADAAAQAETNRARHGESLAAKRARTAENERSARELEGARLEPEQD